MSAVKLGSGQSERTKHGLPNLHTPYSSASANVLTHHLTAAVVIHTT